MHNPVANPSHYLRTGLSPSTFIEKWDLSFNAGNVVKYIARAPHKGKHLEDLEKALWYLLRHYDLMREAILEEPACDIDVKDDGNPFSPDGFLKSYYEYKQELHAAKQDAFYTDATSDVP